MILPCLSVRNHWAWAITHAATTTGGALLIHAGKLLDEPIHEALAEIQNRGGVSPASFEELERGGVRPGGVA